MGKINFIMLVDDDETCNYITEKMISKLDVSDHTLSMKNGKEALRYLEKHCPDASESISDDYPDILLLDINMPVMNGVEFLEEFYNNEKLKQYAHKIKIYMLTSSDNPIDLEKTRQYNVQGYISKPMTPDKIINLIHS